MEFLRKWVAQWGAFLRQLTFAERALVITLATVLVVIFIALALLTGSPTMVPLLPIPADRMAAVRSRLESAGIKVEMQGTQIKVPVDRQNDAMAILAQNDLLSGDTSSAWDEMVARQNPFGTNSQHTQYFMLAKQKVLAMIISKMAGVHSADVLLDMPTQQGFGATNVRPSASVNVVMQSGAHVERHLVEALAGLVSGAVAGLKPQDVVVIDANLGRQFTIKSEEDAGAGERLEAIQQLERYTRDKIVDLLQYIPGVIIAVNVRSDTVLRKQSEKITYDTNDSLSSEESKERERTTTSGDNGEAGVRPNTGISIDGAGGNRTSEKETETHNAYREKPIVGKSTETEVGHPFDRINVTVNVPRRFFVGVFKAGKPADTADPDDAALKPVVEMQLAQIQEQVKPLIEATSAGVVVVHMIPDAGALLAAIGPAGGSAGSSSGASMGMFMQSDLGKMIPVGALVLVALVMMGLLARWATREPKMPTVEELAGVPKPLPSEDELIGEADAHDPTMAGVELDESQIRTRRIAEQIGEMVKTNPGEAASLFSRWIRKED